LAFGDGLYEGTITQSKNLNSAAQNIDRVHFVLSRSNATARFVIASRLDFPPKLTPAIGKLEAMRLGIVAIKRQHDFRALGHTQINKMAPAEHRGNFFSFHVARCVVENGEPGLACRTTRRKFREQGIY
jgi:hypothetical protein